MTDATLISCTNAKRDEPAPARDLYDESGYFRDMRAYAEARGGRWFILSAKHGFVEPDEVLEPYDERGLSEQQAHDIATELDERAINTVHLVAGKDYSDVLTPALEKVYIDVVEVCRGMRIGERRSWLQQRTSELINGSLQC